jgi:hypothetical protein
MNHSFKEKVDILVFSFDANTNIQNNQNYNIIINNYDVMKSV